MHMDSTQDSSPAPKKPVGRPPLNFSKEDREKVAGLVQLGMPQDQIAFSLRISVRSLHKHCRDELYDSAIAANCEVLKKLYQLALNGNPAAATFWAHTRCKFRASGSSLDEEPAQTNPPAASQTTDVEVSNNDGARREE